MYHFVKVKSRINSIGIVVDTDCTYAVGDEGIAAGAQVYFKVMTKKQEEDRAEVMDTLRRWAIVVQA